MPRPFLKFRSSSTKEQTDQQSPQEQTKHHSTKEQVDLASSLHVVASTPESTPDDLVVTEKGDVPQVKASIAAIATATITTANATTVSDTATVTDTLTTATIDTTNQVGQASAQSARVRLHSLKGIKRQSNQQSQASSQTQEQESKQAQENSQSTLNGAQSAKKRLLGLKSQVNKDSCSGENEQDLQEGMVQEQASCKKSIKEASGANFQGKSTKGGKLASKDIQDSTKVKSKFKLKLGQGQSKSDKRSLAKVEKVEKSTKEDKVESTKADRIEPIKAEAKGHKRKGSKQDDTSSAQQVSKQAVIKETAKSSATAQDTSDHCCTTTKTTTATSTPEFSKQDGANSRPSQDNLTKTGQSTESNFYPVVVYTPQELEEAQKSGAERILVKGPLAKKLETALKCLRSIGATSFNTLALVISGAALLSPFTGGVTVMGTLGAAVTAAAIAAISAIGLSLVIAVLKGYEEVKIGGGGLELVIKKHKDEPIATDAEQNACVAADSEQAVSHKGDNLKSQ